MTGVYVLQFQLHTNSCFFDTSGKNKLLLQPTSTARGGVPLCAGRRRGGGAVLRLERGQGHPGLLREEVKSSVEKAPWLSPQDMAAAHDKLRSLEAEIGAYDKHWNLTFVNISHVGINLSEDNSFRDNVLEIYRVLRTELYYLYKEPVDRFSFIWSFTVQPYIVNAFHMHSTNTIVFPEAFFHSPYYTKKGPEYLNYGSAATAMAHEIFHGMDFTGESLK
ncbi:hypothetical protein C7M84_013093 [Penaeus vannamei]|uniref:Peptidase M13 C-terminal domain-containing protein n=1 Tax=Penaeus vannamei TaxID=6689 RepID=A0A423SX33_PENVA|nr:hypothetical protein C7M84_013093 [Penaeus vannamei]